jgi:hypothetical protein
VFAIDWDSDSLESDEEEQSSLMAEHNVILQAGRSGFMESYIYSEQELEEMKMA